MSDIRTSASAQTPEVPDLSGPWEAVLSGDGGYLIGLDEFDNNNHVEIAVVRRSALPINDTDTDDEEYRRRPGTYYSEDVLFEADDFDSDEDLAFRWALAQRVADLLNADDHRQDGAA